LKGRVVKKAKKNHPVAKISKADGFTLSGRPKKKNPALKNLFPLRKKSEKFEKRIFLPFFQIKTPQNSFKPSFLLKNPLIFFLRASSHFTETIDLFI